VPSLYETAAQLAACFRASQDRHTHRSLSLPSTLLSSNLKHSNHSNPSLIDSAHRLALFFPGHKMAVPDARRAPADEVKRLSNISRARKVGLVSDVTADQGINFILTPDASEEEREQVSEFWDECLERAACANLTRDKSQGSALSKYERLQAMFPHLRAFEPLRGSHDYGTSEQNEAILCLLAVYIRSKPKDHFGNLLKAKTIAGHVSSIKTIVVEHLNRPILCDSGGKRLERLIKHIRRQDGPASDRPKSIPLRSAHLTALAHDMCPFCVDGSTWHIVRWALLNATVQCLLRGCEVGTLPNQPFRPALGITWADLIWDDPLTGQPRMIKEDGKTYFVMTIGVIAMKDGPGTRKRAPTTIRSKHPVSEGFWDITCPYIAIRRAWWARAASVPEEMRSATPFFALESGLAVDTAIVREAIRDAAKALGFPHKLFGSSAGRRGGATDLRTAWGSAKGKAMILQRGRWWGPDMDDIYARASALEHAAASGAIAWAAGETLEDITPGWVQPARTRV